MNNARQMTRSPTDTHGGFLPGSEKAGGDQIGVATGMSLSGSSGFIACNTRAPHVPKLTWEFPKIRGTLFWGPYKKDPTF